MLLNATKNQDISFEVLMLIKKFGNDIPADCELILHDELLLVRSFFVANHLSRLLLHLHFLHLSSAKQLSSFFKLGSL